MKLPQSIGIAGTLAATVAVGLLPRLFPAMSLELAAVFMSARFIPVAFAGLLYGLRGGVLAALAASLSGQPSPSAGWVIELVLFCSAGGWMGFLSDGEREHRDSLQRTARDLADAHEKLQQNFEGMKRAERLFALGQLSAGLAHEIRNPLASISGAAGVMNRYPDSHEKRTECLAIVEKECQRLNRLLTNFIDFARPRAPQFDSVDANEVIDAVVALASHAIGRQPIIVRKILSAEPASLECDAEQLQQVLLNLTINAIQASPGGGEVQLEARLLDRSRLVIEVRDQGVGVQPDHIDRLFDPFFTTKESGSGLGLPVAHEIVRQMGGALEARRNHGPGMTFSIVLPLERRGERESKTNPAG